MRIHSVRGEVVPFDGTEAGLPSFRAAVEHLCEPGDVPLRLTVTATGEHSWDCEVESVQGNSSDEIPPVPSIFTFRKRKCERRGSFIGVMLVPTGINCEIGGHAGDATPAARLLASVCDQLFIHPNIVMKCVITTDFAKDWGPIGQWTKSYCRSVISYDQIGR